MQNNDNVGSLLPDQNHVDFPATKVHLLREIEEIFIDNESRDGEVVAKKKNLHEIFIDGVLKSKQYPELLDEVAKEIKVGCKKSKNEATTVSCFEITLYDFIKNTLHIKYELEKEVLVETRRHIAKGKIDSRVGAVITEYKHSSKLVKEADRKKASKQLVEYLEGLCLKKKQNFLGILTDGIICKFIRCDSGTIFEEAFEELTGKHLRRLINSIFSLQKTALTASNLVKDFCEPADDNAAVDLVHALFRILDEKPITRTKMLFDEWKELFRLAHDDKSKQKAIESRTEALSQVIGRKLSSENNDDQYKVLFSLQTAYAIIVKLIAYKVLSRIRFNNPDHVKFYQLVDQSSNAIRIQMNSLEEGAIFRSIGIGNLLEGDFFSWYANEQQWDENLAVHIKKLLQILTAYEDIAIFKEGDDVQDLFKDLYLKIMPDKVRHSLGEFYTPMWLADNLIVEALKQTNKPGQWRGIDPCAGSGIFVTVMIGKILEETQKFSKKKRLNLVLERVKAIDLNPLAVLTTRINYFINVCHLIEENNAFEIPVYLGDASYVPEETKLDEIVCFKYSIKTIKGDIHITLPKSALSNLNKFSQVMTDIEGDIKNADVASIFEKIMSLAKKSERTTIVAEKVQELSQQLVDFEKKEWDGIWARIITNFLTTASLGKFELVVGNPPWIDWKNLPAGYRDRIKSLCLSRHLFSGDGMTGGINLNICALIANVSAQNWLAKDGVLAFLMPQSLLFQQSYEGFRKLEIEPTRNLYFQKFFDWTTSGKPFNPVAEKFLTYFLSDKKSDYKKGIEVIAFKLKKGKHLRDFDDADKFSDVEPIFDRVKGLAGQCNNSNTIFTCTRSKEELAQFKLIAGRSEYIGREGIEFYPQEIFLLTIDTQMKQKYASGKLYLKNYQNSKSKYKIPQETHYLEAEFLHPLIKGVDIQRFNLTPSNFIVPFPYEDTQKIPIDAKALKKKTPLLLSYFKSFQSVITSQTEHSGKIIGDESAEFYALARVGQYSFAKNYVAFRDNSSWGAVVVSDIKTEWGGNKRPQFQNHAVTMCERSDGKYITKEEAHYVCAILNAPIVAKFLLNSSDSRSFKIRPPIKIPLFKKTPTQMQLVELSKKGHKFFGDTERMTVIDAKLDQTYFQMLKEELK